MAALYNFVYVTVAQAYSVYKTVQYWLDTNTLGPVIYPVQVRLFLSFYAGPKMPRLPRSRKEGRRGQADQLAAEADLAHRHRTALQAVTRAAVEVRVATKLPFLKFPQMQNSQIKLVIFTSDYLANFV